MTAGTCLLTPSAAGERWLGLPNGEHGATADMGHRVCQVVASLIGDDGVLIAVDHVFGRVVLPDLRG